MTRIELRTAPEVRRVVQAAFPGYRKRYAYIRAFRPINVNSYWDGGSLAEYAVVELATGARRNLPTRTHPYFDVARNGMASTENSVVEVDHVGNITLKTLPEGFALVQAGTFCGKAATAWVYVNQANLTPLLEGK